MQGRLGRGHSYVTCAGAGLGQAIPGKQIMLSLAIQTRFYYRPIGHVTNAEATNHSSGNRTPL